MLSSRNWSFFWCIHKFKWQGSVHPAPVLGPSLLVWSCVICCLIILKKLVPPDPPDFCQPNFRWSYIVLYCIRCRIHAYTHQHMNIKSNVWMLQMILNYLKWATTSPKNSTAIAVKIKSQELPVLHAWQPVCQLFCQLEIIPFRRSFASLNLEVHSCLSAPWASKIHWNQDKLCVSHFEGILNSSFDLK